MQWFCVVSYVVIFASYHDLPDLICFEIGHRSDGSWMPV